MPDTVIEEKKEEKPLSLKDTIAKTEEDLNKEEKPEKKDPKVSDKKDGEPENKEEKKIELSDDDLVLAKNLMIALKDPEQAPGVIDYLARQNGYTKAEIKEIKEGLESGDKGEKKEAVDEITALFTEQFGEEFAAKLAPAIKKAVDSQVEEKTKDIKASFEKQELDRLTSESDKILNSIGTEFYEDKTIPKPVLDEIEKLIDIHPKSYKQSAKDWLSDLHAIAAAKKGGSLKPVDKTKEEKIERNRNDINRVTSGRRPSPAENETPGKSKTYGSLKEAIAAAEESLQKQFAEK